MPHRFTVAGLIHRLKGYHAPRRSRACTLATTAPVLADSLVTAAVAPAETLCAPDPARMGRWMLKRQAVNGDGIPDFILDDGAVQCSEGGRADRVKAGFEPCGSTLVMEQNDLQSRELDCRDRSTSWRGHAGQGTYRAGA